MPHQSPPPAFFVWMNDRVISYFSRSISAGLWLLNSLIKSYHRLPALGERHLVAASSIRTL